MNEVFRHEAVLYDSDEGYASALGTFIAEGLSAGEPVLAVIDSDKTAVLMDALGSDGAKVHFADMRAIGGNPARIIPFWSALMAKHSLPGRRARGIGEPVWAERSSDELAECYQHESLLNLAFAEAPFTLVCPYDTTALAPDVVAHAHQSHPFVQNGGASTSSDRYEHAPNYLAGQLPPAPSDARPIPIDGPERLNDIRDLVALHAADAHLEQQRTHDLILAVTELATNSMRHGGGSGSLRCWHDADRVVCEVRDQGWIREPLAGRRLPDPSETEGRGLWLVNQVCDLVQLRSSKECGTVVRVFMRTH